MVLHDAMPAKETRNRFENLNLFNFSRNLSRNGNRHKFATWNCATRCNVSRNLSRNAVARQVSQIVASCNRSLTGGQAGPSEHP